LVLAYSELRQLRTQCLKRISVSSTNGDVCAGLSERFCGRFADAFAGSANKGMFSEKRF